jgi:hypothetical protein
MEVADFVNPLIERPNEYVFDASYALKLSDKFSMAIQGSFLTSDLKLRSSTTNDSTSIGQQHVPMAPFQCLDVGTRPQNHFE